MADDEKKGYSSIIMAGGSGTRFWPLSRESNPKQLLPIFGSKTLLQSTLDRLEGIAPLENIIIVTTKKQGEKTKQNLPNIKENNIILEPIGKNTAPCIAIACKLLLNRGIDTPTVVLPADHIINDKELFKKAIHSSFKIVEQNEGIVTLGIMPTYPETGYGYIEKDDLIGNIDGTDYFFTKRFSEKPNLIKAKSYIESGTFFWNAGIFIFKPSYMLSEIEKFMPKLYDKIKNFADDNLTNEMVNTIYNSNIEELSIDYGVMEKSKKVFIQPVSFDWSDVGSWKAFYDNLPKDKDNNTQKGDVLFFNTSGSMGIAGDKTLTFLNVKDIVVVEAGDAILVADINSSQNVKQIVDYLKINNEKLIK